MVIITLTDEEVEIVKEHAKKSEIGGFTPIRKDYKEKVHLSEDQVTGQLGEAALSKYLTGSIDWYVMTREYRDRHLYDGDDGCDLLGEKIDVKTSRKRRGDDFEYHLWIREDDYRPDVTYYLNLMDVGVDNKVYIIGKCWGFELPKPNFEDRREIPMSELTPVEETK